MGWMGFRGRMFAASSLALIAACARGTATSDGGFDAGRNPVNAGDSGQESNPRDASGNGVLDAAPSFMDAAVDDGSVVQCEPSSCVDAISCTADACDVNGSCVHTPSDGLCGQDETCSITKGCIEKSCSDSPCGLVAPQCGCSEGEGCYPSEPSEGAAGLSGEVSCRAAGKRQEGQLCSSFLYDCAPGNLCVTASLVEGVSLRTCQRACNTDVDCGSTGARCVYQLSDRVTGVRAVSVCSTPCDPIGQSGCATGTFCDIYPEGPSTTAPYTDCFGPISGTKVQGETCTDAPCAPGFRCRGTGSSAECAAYCRSDEDCPKNTSCAKAETKFTIGNTTYGLCR